MRIPALLGLTLPFTAWAGRSAVVQLPDDATPILAYEGLDEAEQAAVCVVFERGIPAPLELPGPTHLSDGRLRAAVTALPGRQRTSLRHQHGPRNSAPLASAESASSPGDLGPDPWPVLAADHASRRPDVGARPWTS